MYTQIVEKEKGMRRGEEKINKSNEGYFGKRFVKVYFNVLHQRLACELPPAEVTAAFSVKKGKVVADCLCGK